MKKRKKFNLSEALADIVFELVVILVLLGVGYLVCMLLEPIFSVNLSDLELIAFIGWIAVILLFVAAVIISKLFKKKSGVTHQMKLAPAPFSMIKSGQKTIELRLLDEKRQKIKVGDTIVFTNTETKDTLTVTVKKLHKFASFTELYSKLDLLQCGYTAETVKTASPEDMNQYYSLEKQEKYGVLGIEILIKP